VHSSGLWFFLIDSDWIDGITIEFNLLRNFQAEKLIEAIDIWG